MSALDTLNRQGMAILVSLRDDAALHTSKGEYGMIPEAEAFNAASEAYALHSAMSRDIELDRAIALRQDDADLLAEADARGVNHQSQWHAVYRAEKDTAKALCAAIGVDANRLRWALA